MSGEVTNYTHYFGSEELAAITLSDIANYQYDEIKRCPVPTESDTGMLPLDVSMTVLFCDEGSSIDKDGHSILEWLNSPYEGGKE